MGQINLNNFKVITDKLNTFFVDNKFMVASEIPTTGEFKVGDIIINNGPTNVDEPMWICIEAGNPGTWTVFNSGGGSAGGSAAGRLSTARNRVVLNGESRSEVSIGVSGFNKASDVLMVFINSRFMTEGVDYEINADSTKIVAIGEVWNEELASEFEIEMIVFKMMGEEGVVSSVNEIVKLKNTVIVNEAVNEVEIGIDGFNEGDDLTVYRNSVYMIEDIDYEVQGNKIVSLKGAWNAEGGSDYKFTFEVLKTVAKVNPDAVIGMEHLTEDVKEAIEAAGNIDLSGYATKEELNELFQDVDNGKNLIATSIGNPLITGNSTFSAMSEAILGLRRESENETDAKDVLYGMMIEDGYNEATSNMTVDELIELLDDSQIDTCAIKQIACGESHVFVLKNDGSLWACGLNDKGQLGLNSTTNKTSFTQVTTNINNDVKKVFCGGKHTFIIKNDGSIWATGYNYFGQLGLNNTVDRNVFTQVYTDITDIKQIACGQNYTIILTNDGSLWACGSNNYGEQGLGTSDYDAHSTFTKVTTNINNDVKEVVCGYHSTYILKNDGSLWACGYNNFGQLGLGNTTTKNKFTQVTSNINNDVKQVVCGINFVYILKNDGTVWSCGCNNFGQLGLGTSGSSAVKTTFTQVTTSINNDVKQISCGGLDVSYGYDQVFILKNDGTVWSCGSNYYGQLGLGDTTDRSVFTQVTTNINNDVKQISCGGGQSFIFKNDGTVWSCGYNNFGQLGLGTSGSSSKKTTFTQVSTFSSVEIAEYEINRLKLYYYLLDNEIEVTESMDIGTMLDLLVDDYINNMILGYENNLRIILTDEGVSVSNEDNMDSLITKVDEEFDRQNDEINDMKQDLVDALTSKGVNVDTDDSFDELMNELINMNVGEVFPGISCSSSLPAEVENGHIIIITENYNRIYVDNKKIDKMNLSEGDVYIKYGLESPYTENLNNLDSPISIHLEVVYQMINSEIVFVDEIYKGVDGEWVKILDTRVYYFNEGIFKVPSSGFYVNNMQQYNMGLITSGDFNNYFKLDVQSSNGNSNGILAYGSDYKIDLTQFSKIKMTYTQKCTSTSNYGYDLNNYYTPGYFGLFTASERQVFYVGDSRMTCSEFVAQAKTNYDKEFTIEMDVTNIDGEHYFGIGIATQGTTVIRYSGMLIKSIEFIK